MKIVVLLPTYNEKENIVRLLAELQKRFAKLPKHNFKILVVDDNSPDGTGSLVSDFAKQHKLRNIYLLKGKKQGLGRAMIRGYKYALSELKAQAVITNEADFGFSFKHLPFMVRELEKGTDVVIASRHVGIGKTEGWTLERKLNHWVANTFFGRWVAGIREVYDKNGALRAIKVKGVLDQINWNKFDVTGFGFFMYLVFRLTQLTEKIVEFPSIFRFRTAGESKVSFNPKYIRTYMRDVFEYAELALRIRGERRSTTSN